MSFYYLATPYSKYPAGIQAAHDEACYQAALLVSAGIPVCSPIAHTHPIAINGGIDPYDHKIWLEADRTFMEAAKALIVCKMEGWDTSYGIGVEIDTFVKANKPVFYMTPGVVPDLTLRRPLIGLTGFARCGKDTAAQALVADGWTRVALADGVREALYALDPVIDEQFGVAPMVDFYGWETAKKDERIRRLLQRMGTEAGRNIHGDDCWLKIAKRKLDAANGPVVVTDVRFPNEAAWIRELGGKVVRIERPGVGPVNGHISESQNFEPDICIDNFGTIGNLHNAIRQVAGIGTIATELDERIEPPAPQPCPPTPKPAEGLPLCKNAVPSASCCKVVEAGACPCGG